MTGVRATGGVPHPAWIIQEWLEAHGRSQLWLAEHIGRSTKHVNQILRGHVLWSLETAARIEKATGIPAMELMKLKTEYLLARTQDARERS